MVLPLFLVLSLYQLQLTLAKLHTTMDQQRDQQIARRVVL